MILGVQPRKKWTRWDFLLIEAMEVMKSETCSQCGMPRWACHSENSHIRFRVEVDECMAKAEAERWMDSRQAADKNYKPEPGTSPRAIPYTTDGSDLADYREEYYEQEAKRLQEIRDSLGMG